MQDTAAHYDGLSGWVAAYKRARQYGNVKLAKTIKANINGSIKKHKLDATKGLGRRPRQADRVTPHSPSSEGAHR